MRNQMNAMCRLFAAAILMSMTAAGSRPAVAAAEVSGDLAALLPSAGEVAGWTADGVSAEYDVDNLWEYIDGSADKFLVYGFQRVLVQDYVSGTRDELKVEIYEHESPLYAFGIYSQLRSPGLDAYDIGAEAFGDEYSIHFRKDRYYVRVSIFEKSAELLAAAKSFAAAVAGRIAEGGMLPPELVDLTKWGFRGEDITYVPKGALGRERFPAAFVASYKDGDEKGTLYLFALSDSATARELFDWYAGETSAAITSGLSNVGPMVLGAGKDPYQGDVAALQYRRWVVVVTGFKAGTHRARNLALQTTGMLRPLK